MTASEPLSAGPAPIPRLLFSHHRVRQIAAERSCRTAYWRTKRCAYKASPVGTVIELLLRECA